MTLAQRDLKLQIRAGLQTCPFIYNYTFLYWLVGHQPKIFKAHCWRIRHPVVGNVTRLFPFVKARTAAKAQVINISCNASPNRLHFKSIVEKPAAIIFFKLRALANCMYIATYTYERSFNFIKVVVGNRLFHRYREFLLPI